MTDQINTVTMTEAEMLAYESGRKAGLEQAAAFCQSHQMALPMGCKGPFDGRIADPCEPDDMAGGRHEGMAYAAAIRALKDKDQANE